jgi:hypothetical protein
MNRVIHSPALEVVNGVASLVCPFKYLESLAAVLKHLRHEGQAFELPFAVESLQDFLFAPDFNPLAGVEVIRHALKLESSMLV